MNWGHQKWDCLAFSELTARARKTIVGTAGAMEWIWRTKMEIQIWEPTVHKYC